MGTSYQNKFTEYFGEFKKHLPILNSPLIVNLSQLDEQVQTVIYQSFREQRPHFAAKFAQPEVDCLRDAYIPQHLRPPVDLLTMPSIQILEYISGFQKEVIECAAKIAAVASSADTSNESKTKYQHYFCILVTMLFSSYINEIATGDVLLIPLRSGRFVAETGILPRRNELAQNQSYIETKRLDKFSIVALGEPTPDVRSGCSNMIICDAGIVSGLSIAAILALSKRLNWDTRRVTVFSVYASWYGLMNLFNIAQEFDLELLIRVCIISYRINRDLRAVKTFNNVDLLATGDVGDFLTPIL